MVLHKIPNPVMIRNTHCNPEKKIKFWYKPRRWTDSSHRRLRVEVVQAGKSLPQDFGGKRLSYSPPKSRQCSGGIYHPTMQLVFLLASRVVGCSTSPPGRKFWQ